MAIEVKDKPTVPVVEVPATLVVTLPGVLEKVEIKLSFAEPEKAKVDEKPAKK